MKQHENIYIERKGGVSGRGRRPNGQQRIKRGSGVRYSVFIGWSAATRFTDTCQTLTLAGLGVFFCYVGLTPIVKVGKAPMKLSSVHRV